MPSRSRSRSRRRSRSRSGDSVSSRTSDSSYSPVRAPPPSPVPYPAPTIQNRTGSFANTVMEGFAWGTGTTIARRIFGSEDKSEKKLDTDINSKNESININDKQMNIWEKYNECIKTQSDNTKICDNILLEEK